MDNALKDQNQTTFAGESLCDDDEFSAQIDFELLRCWIGSKP